MGSSASASFAVAGSMSSPDCNRDRIEPRRLRAASPSCRVSLCHTRPFPVTRDSRNRKCRKTVRSPYPLNDEARARRALYIRYGDLRTASRTPDTFTSGETPPVTNTNTNNIQAVDFMDRHACAPAAIAEGRTCTSACRRVMTVSVMTVGIGRE